MKGVIIQCLGELIKKAFGEENWQEILESAGLRRRSIFLATQDVDEAVALKLVESTCKILNLSLPQAGDAFGDYWVNIFAPKIYSVFYRKAKSAKDFLLRMDYVHQLMTKNIPNAQPPRFDYEWENPNTLIMKYKSSRNLIDILVGLVKGVGKYYQEDLTVSKMGTDKVQIIFPGSV